MKKSVYLLSLLFILCCGNSIAQSAVKGQASAYAGAFFSPVLSKNMGGITMELKYSWLNRFNTGGAISMTNRKLDNGFQYNVSQPRLSYIDIGWVNQFEAVNTERLRVGVNVTTGLIMTTLQDDSQKETSWAGKMYVQRSRLISSNYYGMLQPGLDVSFRIAKLKESNLYLTGKAKYRYAMGRSNFASQNDFSGYYLGLGVMMCGI